MSDVDDAIERAENNSARNAWIDRRILAVEVKRLREENARLRPRALHPLGCSCGYCLDETA